ncbi:16S rRNA (guanine(527)-N(7))-methyltransferase RsmG [Cardiobacterium hominis]|uniref:16S rRNA (guanine(527)-N(7))-methyltransferase RsmG n=1 Tax=Cardiobacterium hominis TaxID=2718 RepID=UPI0028D75869|nr:16S rRNA (guanine(527)-N(7))-methyltransferase RsmG [Cardiobacterium hominis]
MLPSGAQEKLERGLDALPFAVDAAERAQFVRYLDLLNKWNQVHNLTAVRDVEEQISRHVLDCLAVLPYIKDAATLADIGSGAGLPALMLAIMRPQLAVTALESNGKKAAFIREAVRVLALANVQVVAQRVEDWQAAPQAVIISRALAAADRFIALTAHLGDANSRWLLMKGREAETLTVSGFAIHAVYPLAVPLLAGERTLLDIRRERA